MLWGEIMLRRFIAAFAPLAAFSSVCFFNLATASAGDQGNVASPEDADPAELSDFNLPLPKFVKKSFALWTTNYYVPLVVGLKNGNHPLLGLSGAELGPRLTEDDWCKGAFEGTVRVQSKAGVAQTYNYAGIARYDQVDCKGGYAKFPDTKKVRFRATPYEFGEGVQDFILVPYRTVAVCNREVAYGSVLFIPAARGAKFRLPSGEEKTHDGYFYAADTGGAMNRDCERAGRQLHIDVFTGTDEVSTLPIITNKPDLRIEASLVGDKLPASLLHNSHLKTK